METLITCVFLWLIAAGNASFINPYPRYKVHNDGDDPGTPLFLTPLIEAGKFDEAKKAAKVTDPLFTFSASYSGFLTVNKQYKSNMFFWYFPSENGVYAPVILWLQGGPGASSLFGLFTENGPYSIDKDGKLLNREYRWNTNHHLIYIDNPVGTGFSFTEDDAGYARNEKNVGADLYEAVLQIFQLFPELQNLDFWITGESYAGKYVPALGYTIYNNNKRNLRRGKKPKANIKLVGLAIGNGLSDPLHQFKYGDYLYQLGLIDFNGRNLFYEYEKNGTKCIKKHDMECAFNYFDELINMDQSPYGSVFRNLTGFDNYYNYMHPESSMAGEALGKFLQSSRTRRAIHVGNKTFHDTDDENKVEKFLKKDIMDTVAPWVAELLKRYTVCTYNGQLDIIVAYPLTESYLQKLKFRGADVYKVAPRTIWKVDNEIAGYYKKAGNLIEVLVRNAGHMAPSDQPKWVFDLINRLTFKKKF